MTKSVAVVWLSIRALPLLCEIRSLGPVSSPCSYWPCLLLPCILMPACSSVWWNVGQGRFLALKLLLERAQNCWQSCIIVVRRNSGEELQKSQALRGDWSMGPSHFLFHSNTNSSTLGCLKISRGENVLEGLGICWECGPTYYLKLCGASKRFKK